MSDFGQIKITEFLGIVTTPNEMGELPPGAILSGTGFAMRDPGKLTFTLRQINAGGSGGAASNPTNIVTTGGVDSTWSVYRDSVGAVWRLAVRGSLVSFDALLSAANGLYAPPVFSTGGRITWTESRQRKIVNPAATAPLIWNRIVDIAGGATLQPRYAGIPAPSLVGQLLVTGSAVPVTSHCNIVAVIRRIFADGYEVMSPPSGAYNIHQGGVDTRAITVNVRWSSTLELSAGDYVDIYRTKTQPYGGSTGTDVGATYRLSSSHLLTSAEVAANGCTFVTDSPDSALGDFLYTNSGQGTAAAAYLPPPAAKCIATFRGHTFYANVTRPASITFGVPNVWGTLPATAPGPRKNGIGNRALTGTLTNTSNTVTAVSAADMVGLVVGQSLADLRFTPTGVLITSVAATSFTVSGVANTTVAGASLGTVDVIIINGTSFSALDFSSFVQAAYLQDLQCICLDGVLNSQTVGIPGLLTQPGIGGLTLQKSWAGAGSFTISATNGANYTPNLPRIELAETPLTVSEQTDLNGYAWSEPQLPEAVPSVNAAKVGSGEIYGIAATRDALWFLCSDGLYRLSGTGGSVETSYDWRTDPVDATLILSRPRGLCVLLDTVYAQTNRGIVGIPPSGEVSELSKNTCREVIPALSWAESYLPTINADNEHDEVTYIAGNDALTQNTVFTYNVRTGKWACPMYGPDQTGVVDFAYVSAGGFANKALWVTKSGTTFELTREGTNGVLGPQGTIQLQPLYGKSPFGLTRWLELEIEVAEAGIGSNGPVIQYAFSGNAWTTPIMRKVPNVITGNRWRGTMSVMRAAPAIAPSLTVQFTVGSAGAVAVSFWMTGVVVRYKTLTNRRTFRG